MYSSTFLLFIDISLVPVSTKTCVISSSKSSNVVLYLGLKLPLKDGTLSLIVSINNFDIPLSSSLSLTIIPYSEYTLRSLIQPSPVNQPHKNPSLYFPIVPSNNFVSLKKGNKSPFLRFGVLTFMYFSPSQTGHSCSFVAKYS